MCNDKRWLFQMKAIVFETVSCNFAIWYVATGNAICLANFKKEGCQALLKAIQGWIHKNVRQGKPNFLRSVLILKWVSLKQEEVSQRFQSQSKYLLYYPAHLLIKSASNSCHFCWQNLQLEMRTLLFSTYVWNQIPIFSKMTKNLMTLLSF